MNKISKRSVPEYAKKPLLGFSTWSSQLLDDVPGYGGKHLNPWYITMEADLQ
jgi:alpha-galactosidase